MLFHILHSLSILRIFAVQNVLFFYEEVLVFFLRFTIRTSTIHNAYSMVSNWFQESLRKRG